MAIFYYTFSKEGVELKDHYDIPQVVGTTRRSTCTVRENAVHGMSSREPQPRWKHAAFGVGLKHFVWGGDGGCAKIQTRQIEVFDISSAKWEEPQLLQGSAPLPDRLWDMAVITDGENAFSFGGWKGSTRINNIYEINSRTLQCDELQPASHTHQVVPQGAAGSRTVHFDEKLPFYAGETDDDGRIDDLYVFDLKKSERGKSKHALLMPSA